MKRTVIKGFPTWFMILDFSDAQSIGFKIGLAHKIIHSDPAKYSLHISNMDTLTEFDRIMYMKDILPSLNIDTIFASCVRGCRFHILQAKQVAVQKLDAIDQVQGKRIIDRFFGATTVSQVELAARMLIDRFPILTSWVNWWKNPLRSCMVFEPYSNISPDLFHLLPANLSEHYGSLYRKLTGGKNLTLLEGVATSYNFCLEQHEKILLRK